MAYLFDDFLCRTHKGRVFTAFRPLDFLIHYRHIHHMQMVVEHITPKLFRQGAVALVGVHDRRQNVLFAAGFLDRQAVGFRKKFSGIFIAAVAVKVRGVHIKNKLVNHFRIRLQAARADDSVRNHTVKGFGVTALTAFEMHVEIGVVFHNIRVGVALIFPLVMAFPNRYAFLLIGFVADNATVCFRHGTASFQLP